MLDNNRPQSKARGICTHRTHAPCRTRTVGIDKKIIIIIAIQKNTEPARGAK